MGLGNPECNGCHRANSLANNETTTCALRVKKDFAKGKETLAAIEKVEKELAA